MRHGYPCSHTVLFLAGLCCALVLAGCNRLPGQPGDDPPPRPEEVLDFNTLYSENCSGCHGTQGKGGAAISLGDPVYQALVDDATLQRIITNGLPGTLMTPFGQSAGGMLTDQQIDALIRGMRTRWSNPGALGGDNPPPYAASASGDPAQGAGVYQAACAMCHGPGGRGGPGVGSIVDGSFLGLVTDQELRTMIIVGVPGTGMPNWKGHAGGPLSSQEISDVVAWLGAQRPQFPGQPYGSSSGSATGGSQ